MFVHNKCPKSLLTGMTPWFSQLPVRPLRLLGVLTIGALVAATAGPGLKTDGDPLYFLRMKGENQD